MRAEHYTFTSEQQAQEACRRFRRSRYVSIPGQFDTLDLPLRMLIEADRKNLSPP